MVITSAENKVWEVLQLANFENERLLYRNFVTATESGLAREVDFLVILRDWGIFVIEAKGYSINDITRVNNEKWILKGKSSTSNPYKQALSGLWGIQNFIEKMTSALNLNYFALIALPNISKSEWINNELLGANLNSQQIIFKDDLNQKALLEKLTSNRKKINLTDATWRTIKYYTSIQSGTLTNLSSNAFESFLNDSKTSSNYGPQDISGTKIFISYRREDSSWPAARLYAHLNSQEVFKGHVFWDSRTIKPGEDWINSIEKALSQSVVLLAVIGEKWLTIQDKNGNRRLDDKEDKLVYEIKIALEMGIAVIPVLIDTTDIPKAEDLPETLQELSRKQALQISPDNFDYKMGILINTIEELIKIGKLKS